MPMYVVGFRLNSEKLEKLFREFLLQQDEKEWDVLENAIDDYIADTEYEGNLHIHFPGISKELKLVKNDSYSG